jgi:hypothetical protein
MSGIPYGPVFHRWLPDGINDAITIPSENAKTEIKVWFQRWGRVQNGEIVLDYRHEEVDVELMKKQGLLVAGSLYGQITLYDVPEDVIDLMRNRRFGEKKYVSLGKGVLKQVVPKVDRFLTILRCTYGQFWIPPFQSWDSRKGVSLGAFCLRQEMKWSVDGTAWEEFQPDIYKLSRVPPSVTKQDYREFLTQEKWEEIKTLCNSEYAPTNGATLFRQAQRLLYEGKVKYAFVEGVTALEAVISEFYRERLKGENELLSRISNMDRELGIGKILILVGVSNKNVNVADLKAAQKAVDVRNEIIHDGKFPAATDVPELLGLFRVILALLTDPKHSFPNLSAEQAIKTSEEWEAVYRSS